MFNNSLTICKSGKYEFFCDCVTKIQKRGHAWVEYKAKAGRNLWTAQRYFSSNPDFVQCHIYRYDRIAGKKLDKVGYFDRNRIDY